MAIPIIYPSHLSWVQFLDKNIDIASHFHGRMKMKVPKGIAIFEAMDQTVELADLDINTNFQAFAEKYEKTMSLKVNRLPINIKERLFQSDKSYKLLNITVNRTYLGGTIFRVNNDTLSIAFAAAEHGSVGRTDLNAKDITEYYLKKLAIETGLAKMVHGRDRNLYGDTGSNIGLAMIKCGYGMRPVYTNAADTIVHKSYEWAGKAPVVIFGSESEEKIDKVFIFTKDKEYFTVKYGKLLKIDGITPIMLDNTD